MVTAGIMYTVSHTWCDADNHRCARDGLLELMQLKTIGDIHCCIMWEI